MCQPLGGHNKYGKKSGVRCFRFPLSDKSWCTWWIAAVSRKDWTLKPRHQISGEHFREGFILTYISLSISLATYAEMFTDLTIVFYHSNSKTSYHTRIMSPVCFLKCMGKMQKAFKP